MTAGVRISWLAAAAVAALAAASPGQWGRYGLYARQQQQQAQARQSQWAPPPQWARPRVSPLAPPVTVPLPPGYNVGFQGLQAVYPQFNTYPTYPDGYGPPPRTGGFLPEEQPDPTAGGWTPRALPDSRVRGWPSWIESGVDERARMASPARAVLARTADRVWVLTHDDTAFVPLAFHDKFRVLESGSAIEVRNKGEFQLAFHDGASVRSLGPVRVGLPRLSPQVAEVQLLDLRRLWITARQRPFEVRLPDGSVLAFADSSVHLEREGERAVVYNHGARPVRWTGRAGEVDIPPAHRIDVLLEPSARTRLGAGLQLEGALQAQRDGRTLEVRGEGDGGVVTWSGARIRVGGGAAVRLDPLAGSEFPEKTP